MDIPALLSASPPHRALLALLAAQRAEAWLAAGFVRDAVWDALAGRTPDPARCRDLDVVYLGASAREEEAMLAARLAQHAPGHAWEVRDQARMARQAGQPRPADLTEALALWPETATAVAARLCDGRVQVLAPHGVADLLAGLVRPTPAHAGTGLVTSRAAQKGWLLRWPFLRLHDA
jgi:uncharacterized protein